MKKQTSKTFLIPKNNKTLTVVTAFLACFMLFTSVFYYTESLTLQKKNQELELRTIQLEGEVQALRNKRMLDSVTNNKKIEDKVPSYYQK